MPRRDLDITLPSLTGTRALITGASDGMGAVIAQRLAAAGAEVLLPVRNRDKGERALAALRDRVPTASAALLDLDLSSLESVAALGARLRGEGRPIHLLIANAGVMTPPSRQTTVDGHELQFGTNHLGNVALVGHLLPLLREGRARVVTQVSIAARSGRIDWDDLDSERSYDAMTAYSRSKIAVGLFGLELGRRSAAHGWGITSALSHPGVAPTSLLAARAELGRTGDTREVRMIRALSRRRILVGTVESAGLPALLAATAPEVLPDRLFAPQGLLGLGGAPGTSPLFPPLRDAAEAARVWERSAEIAGVPLLVGR